MRWLNSLVTFLTLPWILRRITAQRAEIERLRTEIDIQTAAFLGVMVGAWAALEIILDMSNWVTSIAMPGREPFPVSFNRKIDMFKRAHKRLESLADIKDHGLAIAERMSSLGKRRNDMVHMVGLSTLPDHTIERYGHLVPTTPEHRHLLTQRTVIINREDIANLTDQIISTSNDLYSHTMTVIATLAPFDQYENPMG